MLTNHGHSRSEVRDYPLSAMRLYFEGLVAEATGVQPDEERFEQTVDADFSQYNAERERSRKRDLSALIEKKMKAKVSKHGQ